MRACIRNAYLRKEDSCMTKRAVFFLRKTKGTDFPMNIKITNIYQLSNDLACPSQFLHHQSHSEIFGLLNVISRVHTHCIAYSHHGIPLLSTTVDKSNKSTRNVSDDFSHSSPCACMGMCMYVKPHTTNNFAIKINYCSLSCPLILFCCILQCIQKLGCIRCSKFQKICWILKYHWNLKFVISFCFW